MAKYPVVQVLSIHQVKGPKIGVECVLRCGCRVKRRVPPERLFEIIPGRFLLAGEYTCPEDHTLEYVQQRRLKSVQAKLQAETPSDEPAS